MKFLKFEVSKWNRISFFNLRGEGSMPLKIKLSSMSQNKVFFGIQ